MNHPLLSLELARRIEHAEAKAAVEGAESLMRLKPERDTAVEAIAGGFAVYCGATSPITQAIGLGLDGPVSEEEFNKLEEFYGSRSEPIRVETCPLADPSLIEQFGKHGYRITEFTNVMARPIEAGEEWPAPPRGVTIEKCGKEKIDLWTLTVSEGFAEQYAVTEELLEVMRMFALSPSNECYLALLDGRVAGGGTLAVRDGVAGLFGASTLMEFRNRGVQTALLHARLARAAASGCDLAVCLARPGSISQRNIVRQDFRVLYTRVKFEKEAW